MLAFLHWTPNKKKANTCGIYSNSQCKGLKALEAFRLLLFLPIAQCVLPIAFVMLQVFVSHATKKCIIWSGLMHYKC